MRAAYEHWFRAWMRELPPARRCALHLLALGAATGPALRRRTSVLASSLELASFMPEAAQLYLPMACSAAELAELMDASIVLLGADGQADG